MSVLTFFRRFPTSCSNQLTGSRRARRVGRGRPPRRAVFLEPLEDRRLLSIDLVSIADPSMIPIPNLGSYYASISADGRYVAFDTAATNLVDGDTNGTNDVFVHDLTTGVTTRVSVGTDTAGNDLNWGGYSPSISADGRYVAFRDEVTINTNGVADVFVKDLSTGITTRASSDSAGNQGNDGSYDPSVSAGGRYVAFESGASNLVSGDTNGDEDIFVKDLWTGITTRASTDSAGNQGIRRSNNPSVSADGRYVAFDSWSNLISGGANLRGQIFVKDLRRGNVALLSSNSAGNPGNQNSVGASVSADGRYVAFLSNASNLVSGDTNAKSDIFATLNPLAWVPGSHVVTVASGETVTGIDFGNHDILPPTAEVVDVTPDPRTTAVDKITIGFGEAVAGFNLPDLTLTRNGGSNLLTGSQTLTTSDNITWELGNLSGLTGIAGSYVLTLTAAGSGVTDLAGNALAADASDAWTTNSTIAGRRLFYNNSKFDGHAGFLSGDPAANEFDDAAIAPDKEALLPGGGTAAFKNYTTFFRGLNGLMIDVAGLPGTVLAATDFIFKYGNDSTPGDWLAAASPTTIAVRAGAGTGGSDRVTLVWPDKAIPNGNWLQVTVLANADTGLAADDVFYFGCAIGETGNTPADAVVNFSDVTRTRNNFSGFNLVGLESVYDFNRDRQVASGDVTISRNHFSGFTPLKLIAPPGSAPAPGPLGEAPLLAAGSSAPLIAAEGQASAGKTAAHDAVFRGSFDRWDLRLYADLALSWELARPRPKQKPSEGDFSSQDVRHWMLADHGR